MPTMGFYYNSPVDRRTPKQRSSDELRRMLVQHGRRR